MTRDTINTPRHTKKDNTMVTKTQLVDSKDYYDAAKAAWELRSLINALLIRYDHDGYFDETLRAMVIERARIATERLGLPDISDIPF